jgi:FAD-dependent urate hydroxylase
VVTGRSMGFWRDHMPEGMYLRSGPDWHLDYAEWFRQAKGIEPLDDLVEDVVRSNGHFTATLSSGERIDAEAVVAAPGIAPFTHFPAWADSVPPDRATHTCYLMRFDDLPVPGC